MKSIKVFGRTYKIRYKKMSEELHGECHNSKAIIDIDRNLKGKEKAQTIIHELFHAAIYRLSLNQVLSDDIEEIICDNFATFLVENDLIKFPTEE